MQADLVLTAATGATARAQARRDQDSPRRPAAAHRPRLHRPAQPQGVSRQGRLHRRRVRARCASPIRRARSKAMASARCPRWSHLFPPGQTKPGRVKAIEQLSAVREQNRPPPTSRSAILPFETSPMQPWPNAGGFAPPDPSAIAFCDALQAPACGNGTDTKGSSRPPTT